MGTVVSFDVPARAGEPRGDGSLGRAVRWLHWVDATFSPYRDDSDVSRFGRGALPLAQCAPELAEVLAKQGKNAQAIQQYEDLIASEGAGVEEIRRARDAIAVLRRSSTRTRP